MNKIFLSHSSADKNYIEKVVETLGHFKCVYDSYTFELGMPTMEEILKNLDETDIFVYFISDNSLDSEWVNTELKEAYNRFLNPTKRILKIFPIIIDNNINHEDDRIADFLKREYNLRFIKSPIIAARKIIDLLASLEYEKSPKNQISCFYGRENELTAFKRRFDSPTQDPLKTIIVSGIPGIGKKSFLTKALKEVMVIKNYYQPVTISLEKNSGIVDLILQLCEAGFGDYSLEELSNISMDNYIEILTNILNEIMLYKEIVIVEDEAESLVKYGEVIYWLDSAFKKSKSNFSIVITCTTGCNINSASKHPYAFFTNLSELDRTESIGVFRTFSSTIGLDLTRDECLYFKDVFSGYPPQIRYCANLIAEKNFDYVKNNTNLISEFPKEISIQIIKQCCNYNNREIVYGILALFSKIDLVPSHLINRICKINNEYRNVIITLKQHLICYNVGASNEYLKVNSFIQDYISRSKVQIPEDILNLLNEELNEFNKQIEEDVTLNQWDTSELKYFIKKNIINENLKSRKFLYPTLLLQIIVDLYNSQKFNKLIDIVKYFKENSPYLFSEKIITDNIQRYYCQSLIKINSSEALVEAQYFNKNNNLGDYYYLQGYYYRYNANYKKAEELLKKAIDKSPNHYAAARELALVYLTLQDYDSAIVLSKKNYERNPENIYAIQQYFESLIEAHYDSSNKEEIEKMKETVEGSSEINNIPIYYQIIAEYHAYVDNDFDLAKKTLIEARKVFPCNMYIERLYFDICRRYKKINGMKEALDFLRKSTIELQYKGVLYSREAILDSHLGKSEQSIRVFLNDKKISSGCIESIISKCNFSS